MRGIVLLVIALLTLSVPAYAGGLASDVKKVISNIEYGIKSEDMLLQRVLSNGTIESVVVVDDIRMTITHGKSDPRHLHFYIRKDGTRGTNTLVTVGTDGDRIGGIFHDSSHQCYKTDSKTNAERKLCLIKLSVAFEEAVSRTLKFFSSE